MCRMSVHFIDSEICFPATWYYTGVRNELPYTPNVIEINRHLPVFPIGRTLRHAEQGQRHDSGAIDAGIRKWVALRQASEDQLYVFNYYCGLWHFRRLLNGRFGQHFDSFFSVDNGKTILATVQDSCPGCTPYGLDLSPAAFRALAPIGAGRITVSWSY